MGNSFSTEAELNVCSSCNTSIPYGKNCYIDMACGKCNQRHKGHYHADCWHDYVDKCLESDLGVFKCPSCAPHTHSLKKIECI